MYLSGFFIFLSWKMRNEVKTKYNVEEDQACCCGECNPICNFCHFNCSYPCSFFQVIYIINFNFVNKFNIYYI